VHADSKKPGSVNDRRTQIRRFAVKPKNEHQNSKKVNSAEHKTGIDGKLAALARLLGKLTARDVYAAQVRHKAAPQGGVNDGDE
jgi:hypothetical protein